MIDPALQLAGNAEVIHGQTEHHVIRSLELGDQRLGKVFHCLLLVSALIRRGKKGANPLAVQMRNRLCRQVTHYHGRFRVLGLQTLHLLVDQSGRIAVIAEDAAFDDQNIHDPNSL